jgi:hypothetical protein
MDVADRRTLDLEKGIATVPGRRVYGAVRSHAEYLGERLMGGLVDAVHGLLFRTGVLMRVSKWRTVAPPRARLPLPLALPLAHPEPDPTVRTGWRVASGVAFQAVGAPPPPGCEGAGGETEGPSLWVTDQRTGLHVAYAVEHELAALAALVPGAPAPGLSPELGAALAEAGALRPDGETAPVEVNAEREHLAREMATDGFVLIRDLVSPGLLAALRTHYLALPGQVRLEADPFSGRLVEKNEAVARHLLHGFTGFVGALAGRAVQPSYCYSMWYGPGARLRVHRDNALCEYSLNLVIDQQPADPAHWPLCLVSRRGRIEEAYIRPGDALLFCGRELAHFRRRLRDQGSAIGILFHYVHADFAGDLKAAGAYD